MGRGGNEMSERSFMCICGNFISARETGWYECAECGMEYQIRTEDEEIEALMIEAELIINGDWE